MNVKMHLSWISIPWIHTLAKYLHKSQFLGGFTFQSNKLKPHLQIFPQVVHVFSTYMAKTCSMTAMVYYAVMSSQTETLPKYFCRVGSVIM